MALILYSAVTVLLSLIILRHRSRFVLLLLHTFPFFFLFSFLWFTRDNYQILQVKKAGYQFEKVSNDYRRPSRSIMLGGDQQKDDLFLSDLPAGALKLTPSIGDSRIQADVAADGVLLERNRQLLNSTAMKDGDRVQCGDQELVFHSGGSWKRSITANGKEWRWPAPEWKLGKKEAESIRKISLREVSDALGVKCDTRAVLVLNKFRFESVRRPLAVNSILLAGTGNKLRLNGSPIPDMFSFSHGDRIQISAADGVSRPAASYTLRNGETFDLLYSAPQILGVKQELLRNGGQTNKPLFVTTTALPYSVFPTAHYARESSRFSGLFAYVQTKGQLEPRTLQEKWDNWFRYLFFPESSNFEVVTEEGAFRPAYGDYFTLGRTDRLILSVGDVGFPNSLLLIVLSLLLLKTIFQPPFFSSIESVPGQLILVTVDFFLITRFLFSFRAASLYPFSQESVSLSLLAILLVPYLIFCAAGIARESWTRGQLYNFAAYSVLAPLSSAILLPEHLWLVFLIAATTAVIAVVRIQPRLSQKTEQLVIRLRSVPAEGYLLMFFVMMLLLQMLGAGEALQIGAMRFPLSLVYHPAFILLSSYYLYQIRLEQQQEVAVGRQRILLGFGKLLLTVLCFLVASLFTADLGFFLLYCIPVVFVLFGLAVFWIAEYELRSKAVGLLLASPAVIFLALFVGSGEIDRLLPVSSFENRYIQRILLSVDPTALEQSGLITTEKQLGHQRSFLAYAHSGIAGGGYMNRPITSALSATALNDNVPSVFLLNDFGMLGFLAVILILFAWAFFWMRAGLLQTPDYGAIVSLAALITFIYVDLYMIYSNCGIFLFSGKNVFLWGLNSISDILHATLLLILILMPFTKQPSLAGAGR